MAVARLQAIASHLRGNPSASSNSENKARLFEKHPDDVVVTCALRTPLCKSRKGGYKDATSDDLLLATFIAARENIGIDPAIIGDIAVGTVLTKGAPYAARAAALTAGFPETVPLQIVNRFCSSGLVACGAIANQIRNGEIDVGLAVGYESMTANPDEGSPEVSQQVKNHPVAKDTAMPMGWTSENVAGDFGISREDMDKWAAQSHNRAERAQKDGTFAAEIVPVTVPQKQADGSIKMVKVSQDDGIRPGTTPEGLAKLRGAFPQWPPSQTTGGNASQITDGGAFVVLMRRSKAEELGLPILAKELATVSVGLAPRIMGIGPSIAVPRCLEVLGLTIDDVDMFEINEAFSSMMVYCVNKLGLDPAKVNVNGGAIAIGHPLGCTGARQVATGLNAIKRTGGKLLLTTMCVGLGQGVCGAWVNEQ